MIHHSLQSSDFRSCWSNFPVSTVSIMKKHDAQKSTHGPKTVKGTTEEVKQPHVRNAEAKKLVILTLSFSAWVMRNIIG